MTRREIERTVEEYNYLIADKFKDLQLQANTLKYAEDRGKNAQTFLKIRDIIDEVNKAYEAIDDVEATVPDDDEDGYSY